MKNYNFTIQRKVTAIVEEEFNIMAETEEEALRKAKRFILFKESPADCEDYHVDFIGSCIDEESVKPVELEDNNGEATVSLYRNNPLTENFIGNNIVK